MDSRPSMLRPALIGGLASGTASGIPLVGALNCLCCSLLIGGGFLAAFLYSKDLRQAGLPFAVGGGALVGLLTAPFHALGAAVVGGAVQLIVGKSIAEQFELVREQLEGQASIPPEALEMLDKFAGMGPALVILFGIGMNLVMGAVFCTVGGLIGGAVFKRDGAAGVPPGV